MCVSLTLLSLQVAVAVAVGLSQAVFLQVSPDAEPVPLHLPLTLQLGLVHRVHHCKNALPVALGAAAVGRGGLTGRGSAGLGIIETQQCLVGVMKQRVHLYCSYKTNTIE